MPIQILLNLLIAFLWVFLQDEDQLYLTTFFSGYAIGLGFIFLFRRIFPDIFYPIRLWAVFKLLYLFAKELIHSSVFVISRILRPNERLTPGIFLLETDLESDWEITVLSMLLMLTPGSVVIEVMPGKQKLYIHGMDLPQSIDMINKTKQTFEQAIKEVIR